MKKTFKTIAVLLIFAAFCVASYGSATHQFKPSPVPRDTPMLLDKVIELEEIETPAHLVVEKAITKTFEKVPLVRTSEFVNLTFEEMDLLEQIAYAEARGEGSVGMALVMRVVLNRSLRDNMSVREVIYAPGQFYTAGMTPSVSEECHEALAMVMDGWDESQGACYFTNSGYSPWGTEQLFKYGNHYFSK